MKVGLKTAIAAAVAFSTPAAATAAEVITIGSDVDTNRQVTVGFFGPIGQSFTAVTDDLTSFGFEFSTLNPTAANTALTFSLFAGETLTGAALFTTTFTLPGEINSRNVQQFIDIALPNIAVLRGSQYSAVVTASSDRAALLVGPGFIPQTGQFTGGDAFAGGRLLTESTSIFPNCRGAGNNCDANFRVTGNLMTAAVPEPATWAMLLFGFAGAGAMLRRRTPSQPRLRLRYRQAA